MDRKETIDTVVVGAGQAGLITSQFLAAAGRDHVLLERRATLGGSWQDRWDEFRLVSPNWTLSPPGYAYDGPEPDGYMPRDEIVARWRAYAERIAAPVRLGAEVTRLRSLDDEPRRFRLETSAGPIDARVVIIAAGGFQVPRIPEAGATLPASLHQVHSSAYRREADLPAGAVLVVGSGQSGVQLTEELVAAGRRVILAVGRCGRMPRRYRGRDAFAWFREMMLNGEAAGAPLPTAASLPDPRLRYGCNPHLSGHGGGHTTNLRAYGAAGVTLVGRIAGGDGTRVTFAPGIAETLAFADRFFDERFRPEIERLIAHGSLDVPPPEDEPVVAYEPPEILELDVAAEGISSVLWTTGFRLGFADWIDLPIFDADGFPRASRGIPEVPGLGFVGVPWQTDLASSNLIGIARDAEHVAARLT